MDKKFQVTFSIKQGLGMGCNIRTVVFNNDKEYDDFVQPYVKTHINGKIIGEGEKLYID